MEATINNKNKIKNQTKNKKLDLIYEYRKKTNNKSKLKFVSSLNDSEKNILYSEMTKKEINEYKILANDLMERRFSNIIKNKELLDYLLNNPIDVQYSLLKTKYKDVDLSITVYTIKAIINVMGESRFSKDDGSSHFNPKSVYYYSVCKKYWDNIWWDTDTGRLSKEDIENENYSEYHKMCNTVDTIADIRRYLHLLKIYNFNRRYHIKELSIHYVDFKKKQELKKIQKIEAKKKEKELEERRKCFYKSIKNKAFTKSNAFNKYAKNLGYNIDSFKLILYKAVSEDTNLVKLLSKKDKSDFKKKALYTIECHSKYEYNKIFVKEANNVLKNLS